MIFSRISLGSLQIFYTFFQRCLREIHKLSLHFVATFLWEFIYELFQESIRNSSRIYSGFFFQKIPSVFHGSLQIFSKNFYISREVYLENFENPSEILHVFLQIFYKNSIRISTISSGITALFFSELLNVFFSEIYIEISIRILL